AIRLFFSSRRRHTRFSRDWSSDVCSSDLQLGARDRLVHAGALPGAGGGRRVRGREEAGGGCRAGAGLPLDSAAAERGWPVDLLRSEERRVGKAGREGGEGEPTEEWLGRRT